MLGTSVFRSNVDSRSKEQIDLRPSSTVGVVVKGDQIRGKSESDPWVMSLLGMSPLEARNNAQRSDKADLAVVIKTPDGKDYHTFFGPRFTDGTYSGRSGKTVDLSEAAPGAVFLADVIHSGGKFHSPTVIGLYRIEAPEHGANFSHSQAVRNTPTGHTPSASAKGPGQGVPLIDEITGKEKLPENALLQNPQGGNLATGTTLMPPVSVERTINPISPGYFSPPSSL